MTNIKTKITWKTDTRKGVYIDDFGFCYEDDGYLNDYWWTEGNGACDCNRSRMFLGEDWPCGEKIEIISIEPLSPSPRSSPNHY